jgi:hypothetical protein
MTTTPHASSDLDAFVSELRLAARDPAFILRFKARYPEIMELIVDLAERGKEDRAERRAAIPCPARSEITALQVGVMDNWPKGKRVKGYPVRHRLTFDAWACPASEINWSRPTFKGGADLMTAKDARERVAKLSTSGTGKAGVRNPISEDYASALGDLIDAFPNDRIGLLYTRAVNSGTFYHEGQFVVASLSESGSVTSARLFLTPDLIEITSWAATYADGRPLQRNCTRQARLGNSSMLGWQTQNLY